MPRASRQSCTRELRIGLMKPSTACSPERGVAFWITASSARERSCSTSVVVRGGGFGVAGNVGSLAVGVDQSLAMLRLARQRATLSPLFAGEIQSLPFLDESFDCVSGVTVVQHIPLTQQEQALREIVRVLRPDGYLILFELIRGHGPHVFSRTPAGWISQVSTLGLQPVLWFGQEFLLLDRLLVALLLLLRGLVWGGASQPLPGKSQGEVDPSGLPFFAKQLYWMVRRISVVASLWIEPLVARICPKALATHGVFLFQKKKAMG